jgi:hypothetical protein
MIFNGNSVKLQSGRWFQFNKYNEIEKKIILERNNFDSNDNIVIEYLDIDIKDFRFKELYYKFVNKYEQLTLFL